MKALKASFLFILMGLCSPLSAHIPDITTNTPQEELKGHTGSYICITGGHFSVESVIGARYFGIYIPWVSHENAVSERNEVIAYVIKQVALKYPDFTPEALGCGFQGEPDSWFVVDILGA